MGEKSYDFLKFSSKNNRRFFAILLTTEVLALLIQTLRVGPNLPLYFTRDWGESAALRNYTTASLHEGKMNGCLQNRIPYTMVFSCRGCPMCKQSSRRKPEIKL